MGASEIGLRSVKTFYAESLFARLSRFGKFKFKHWLASVTASQEGAFRDASRDARRAGAKYGPWVTAQFEVFDVASARSGRLILPRPFHLKGDGALRRWTSFEEGGRSLRSEGDAILSFRRSTPGTEGHFFEPVAERRDFSFEQRKLDNMCRLLKEHEDAVLRRLLDEFTPGFVAFKGL